MPHGIQYWVLSTGYPLGVAPAFLDPLPPRLYRSLLRVICKRLRNLPFLLVSLVEDHAVAKRQGIALFHDVLAVLLAAGEVAEAPGVGGKQAVAPYVPAGGIAEAG